VFVKLLRLGGLLTFLALVSACRGSAEHSDGIASKMPPSNLKATIRKVERGYQAAHFSVRVIRPGSSWAESLDLNGSAWAAIVSQGDDELKRNGFVLAAVMTTDATAKAYCRELHNWSQSFVAAVSAAHPSLPPTETLVSIYCGARVVRLYLPIASVPDVRHAVTDPPPLASVNASRRADDAPALGGYVG
jgi:hypothetical protein